MKKIFHDVEGNELELRINHRNFLYLEINNHRYEKYAYIVLCPDDMLKLISKLNELSKEVVNE